MDVYDTVHLPCRHDAEDTFRCADLADCGVGSDTLRHLHRVHLARQQSLSYRHFDVRQEDVMEGNLQVDKILKKYFVSIEKYRIFARLKFQ